MTDPVTGTMAAFPDPGPVLVDVDQHAAAPVSLGLVGVAADLGLPDPAAALAAAPSSGTVATVTPLLTAADVDPDPVLPSAHRRRDLERELAELEAHQAAADAADAAAVDQAADVGQAAEPSPARPYVDQAAELEPGDVDHAAAELASAQAFHAAAAPVPVIEPDSMRARLAAAASAAADVDQVPAAAAASSPSSPAPGSTAPTSAAADQSALNHAYISRVLGEARTVAGMLHGAGKHHVALELERAVNLAVELGTALQVAGL